MAPQPATHDLRPATAADLEAVTAAVVASQRANGVGAFIATADDIAGDWSRPSMDLATDTRLVEDDTGRVVAYADYFAGRCSVEVHPDARGRGIGSALAAWSEQRARQDGQEQVGQTIPDTASAARDLLMARGYVKRWDTWALAYPLADEPPSPQPLDGIEIRTLVRPDDDRDLYDVVEAAFSTWDDRDDAMAFEDWRATWLSRATDLDLVLVAVAGDRLVGASIGTAEGGDGWVDQLAVVPDAWGRGIGGALLMASFGRFHDRGLGTARLTTESRTGALGLYLHVGMEVTETFTRWTLPLR